MGRKLGLVVMLAMLVSACAQAGSTPTGSGTSGGQAPAPSGQASTGPKSIVIGLDEDIKNFWEPITLGGGSGARELSNIFNAHLVAITADGSPTPRLLAELPSFDNGTWRVLPDGKMETTYKLRPNAAWHDGTPFTAKDLAFSLQVNKDPEVPNSNQDAMRLVERWETVDPTTVTVIWRETYPFPDRMEHRDLYPLPRHLVEAVYAQGSPEAFLAAPYFNTEYVGLGPFKVARWESGSSVEFTAFDQYFLGRPKLDAIRVQFIPDNNTMVANLNAKAIQMMLTLGGIPEVEAMLGVKRDWEASGYGTVLMDPISYRFVEPQKYHNPQPQDLTNPKVRQALLLAIDRPALANAVFGEFGIVADSWVHPSFGSYRALQDAIVKHPYDPRRAQALLEEVGWRPSADGILAKAGQKFNVVVRDTSGEAEFLIIAANWKEVGVNATYELRTAAALRDRQDRATFSGADISANPMGVAAVVRRTASYNIPKDDNRWTGTNRGGYVNPVWDDLELRMLGALEERARLDIERELLRVYTTDLPLLPLYFRNDMVPVGGGVKGPVANTGVAHRGFILHTWNVHEWEVR
jgi:peptide/nickel transport system substrate-binding protein